MSVLAYIELVAVLFLPGIAFIELFKVGREWPLAEKLALAFGMGMSIDVLIMLVRESGYFYGPLAELSSWGIGVCLVGIAIPFVYRKKLLVLTRPSNTDLAVFALVGLQALLVYVHYLVYPIFPQFNSGDFSAHVTILDSLRRQGFAPLSQGVLYYGAYMPMLQLLAFSGESAFVASQRTMEILVVLSPLLVYTAASILTDSKRVSLVATFIYVAGGFVWYGSVFNSGLYPNFYGILSTLVILVSVGAILKAPKSPFVWAVYLISLANALFSHYSTITLIPALVLLPVLGFAFSRKVDRRFVGIAIVPLVIFASAVALYPNLIGALESVAVGGGAGNVTSDTSLSAAFSAYPFLRYLAVEITSDSATVVLLLLAAAGSFFAIRTKKAESLVALIWVLSVAVTAPLNGGAWRYSYTALLPLCLLAALGFSAVLELLRPKGQVKRRRDKKPSIWDKRETKLLVVGVILLLTVAGSWGQRILSDYANQTPNLGQAQRDVYSSMLWFGSHTYTDSSLVSVTDSRYTQTGLIAARRAAYAPLATPDQILKQLNGTKDLYVVITAVATFAQSTQNPFTLYSNDNRFQQVYRNPDVIIYKVVSFASAAK